MTAADAAQLPPCPTCGSPTEHRLVAGLLCCQSGQCDWTEPVEEPLRHRGIAEALLKLRAEGRL